MRTFGYRDLGFWTGFGYQVVVTEKLGDSTANTEVATFLLRPFTSFEMAYKYITNNVGVLDIEHQTIYVIYDIADQLILEMAEGVTACEFFVEENLN